MADGIYPTLGRQSGLMREMAAIAQNVANASTTGYRAGGILFSEHVVRGGRDHPSVSMAHASAQTTRHAQGALERTGGTFDLAIEGEGFFLIDRDGTEMLTRAGAFVQGPDGGIATNRGEPLLDAGGAPVLVPPGTGSVHVGPDGGIATNRGEPLLDAGGAPVLVPPGTGSVHVGPDGTLSADGAPVTQVAVVAPLEPDRLARARGTTFLAEDGHAPVEAPRVLQGFLEASNVDPVTEIARMVAVQNAYELGQSFLEKEDQRLRSVARLLEP